MITSGSFVLAGWFNHDIPGFSGEISKSPGKAREISNFSLIKIHEPKLKDTTKSFLNTFYTTNMHCITQYCYYQLVLYNENTASYGKNSAPSGFALRLSLGTFTNIPRFAGDLITISLKTMVLLIIKLYCCYSFDGCCFTIRSLPFLKYSVFMININIQYSKLVYQYLN